MRSYSPDEFRTRLASNELPAVGEPVLHGLARTTDGSTSTIEFSTSRSCDDWLTVPTDLIESIDHLGTVKCQDHTHPLVRLQLQRPDPERQDVAFLLGLTYQLQASLSRAVDKFGVKRAGVTARDGCTDCRIVFSSDKGGLVVCCWCSDGEIVCTGIA